VKVLELELCSRSCSARLVKHAVTDQLSIEHLTNCAIFGPLHSALAIGLGLKLGLGLGLSNWPNVQRVCSNAHY